MLVSLFLIGEKNMSKPITIYVSHPIRPNKFTREENLRLAKSCATKLRKLFPEVCFYVPGEGEAIFQAVKEAKLLTEDGLIAVIDLKILSKCDAHLCLYWDSSYGCIKEREFAATQGIPSLTILWLVNKASYTAVRKAVLPLVNTAIERRSLIAAGIKVFSEGAKHG